MKVSSTDYNNNNIILNSEINKKYNSIDAANKFLLYSTTIDNNIQFNAKRAIIDSYNKTEVDDLLKLQEGIFITQAPIIKNLVINETTGDLSIVLQLTDEFIASIDAKQTIANSFNKVEITEKLLLYRLITDSYNKTETNSLIDTLLAAGTLASQTLTQLAAALNNDMDFGTNILNQINSKAPIISVYGKEIIDEKLLIINNKELADILDLQTKINLKRDITDSYDKTHINNSVLDLQTKINLKRDILDSFNKVEITDKLLVITDKQTADKLNIDTQISNSILDYDTKINLKRNIIDSYTNIEIDDKLLLKYDKTQADLFKTTVYSKGEINTALSFYDNKDVSASTYATKLLTYSKTECDLTFETIAKVNLFKTTVYSKGEIDTALTFYDNKDVSGATYATKLLTYSKTEINEKFDVSNTLINTKIDKTDVYTKTEIDVHDVAIGVSLNNRVTTSNLENLYYNKIMIDGFFNNYYNKTAINEYITGITNAINNRYTKDDIDIKFGSRYTKEEVDTFLSGYYSSYTVDNMLSNYYNKGNIDDYLLIINTSLNNKYTKSEINILLGDYYDKYSIDVLLGDYYDKSYIDVINSKFLNIYNKSEVDNLILSVALDPLFRFSYNDARTIFKIERLQSGTWFEMLALDFNSATNHTELYIDKTNYTTRLNSKISQSDLEAYLALNYNNKAAITYLLSAYFLSSDMLLYIEKINSHTTKIADLTTTVGINERNLDTAILELSAVKILLDNKISQSNLEAYLALNYNNKAAITYLLSAYFLSSDMLLYIEKINSHTTKIADLITTVGINERNLDTAILDLSAVNILLNTHTTDINLLKTNYNLCVTQSYLTNLLLNYKTIVSYTVDYDYLLSRINGNTNNIADIYNSINTISGNVEYQSSRIEIIASELNLCVKLHSDYYFDVSNNNQILYINSYSQGRNIHLFDLGYDCDTEVFTFKVNNIDIFDLINSTLHLSDLTDALVNYVPISLLNSTLLNYKTNAQNLLNFKTIASFDAFMLNYKTNAENLLLFKTISSFNTDIANYKTIASFNTDIGSYLRVSTYNTAMLDYTKLSAVEALLTAYVKTIDLNTAISNNTTINNNTTNITNLTNNVNNNTTNITNLTNNVNNNTTNITNLTNNTYNKTDVSVFIKSQYTFNSAFTNIIDPVTGYYRYSINTDNVIFTTMKCNIIASNNTGTIAINNDTTVNGALTATGVLSSNTSIYVPTLYTNIIRPNDSAEMKLDGNVEVIGVSDLQGAVYCSSMLFKNLSAITVANNGKTLQISEIARGILTLATSATGTTNWVFPSGTDVYNGLNTTLLSILNKSFEFSIINLGNQLLVVNNTATDHILVGSGNISANTSGRFQTRITGVNTATTYRIA